MIFLAFQSQSRPTGGAFYWILAIFEKAFMNLFFLLKVQPLRGCSNILFFFGILSANNQKCFRIVSWPNLVKKVK